MGQDLLRNLGTGLNLGSTLGQGRSAQKQAEANAEIDRRDAAILMEESHRRAALMREQGRKGAKQEKVRAAGAGFTQEGTSLQLQIDQIEAAEFNALEELRVGSAAERRALNSAALNVQRGKVARKSSLFNALGVGVQALGSKEARNFQTASRVKGQEATSKIAKKNRKLTRKLQ